ncbi:hypothetical protein PLESTB_000982400 [Pleodorina starrii]|uniref:Carbohydrate kinase PfkB domain-containing protein n=1 Tax=Pleodorina starrii TaxID=330485 RepID=A0A9W6F3T0_9CHLO|nr:hypothetical protein PLESTB_000982400 [Pleodorina starrii]
MSSLANHGLAARSAHRLGRNGQARCATASLRPSCSGIAGARGREARLRVLGDASHAAHQTSTTKVPGDSKVICVGEALFDLIADQKGLPRDKVTSWTPHAGGAPCNVATAAARLGLDVTFVTALGDDEWGEQLMAVCRDRGVRLHAVQRPAGRPTRDVYVVRDSTGDREFAGFGLPGTGEGYADAFIDPEGLPLGELRTADLIKLSDADLEALLGIKLALAFVKPGAVAERFPNARGVLITAGSEGAAYCFHSPTKGEHSGVVPAFDVGVTDTTGAGDAFTAGFIVKMVEAGGLDALAANPQLIKEAVVFASAAGASTCTRSGAIEGQPTRELVQDLYETSKKWYNFW